MYLKKNLLTNYPPFFSYICLNWLSVLIEIYLYLVMSFIQHFKTFILLAVFSFVFFNYATSESPQDSDKKLKEWGEDSENITILDTDEVNDIVKKKSAILLDVWKKDIKPEKLDHKKWMPAQRYSISGAKWIPNAGLETLTPELRKYFQETVKRLTKGNKDAKLVCFCRRGYYAKIAAERLVRMGYTNVFLYPGTDLWEDTGNRLVIVKPEVMRSKK